MLRLVRVGNMFYTMDVRTPHPAAGIEHRAPGSLRPYERNANAPKLGDPNFTVDSSNTEGMGSNRITVDCP